MIARWPARIPAKRTSAQAGITMDLTATLLAATGAVVPADAKLEGVDLLPVLEGKVQPFERTLFFRNTLPNSRTQRAVRRGDWKVLADGPNVMVFNLRDDPGERNDLARTRQDIARTLRPLIAEWEKDVDAR
jgi:arylsulfatase A-like enzyme